VIRLRALILTLFLQDKVEKYPAEFANLWLKLPEESTRILCLDGDRGTLVQIIMPWIGAPLEVGAKLRSTLAAFDNWDIIEVTGETASKHPWMSALEGWMNQHLRGGRVWERPKSQNVPLTERRKPRGGSAI